MTTSLTNRALLVTLQISQWSARKFDRKETAELAAKHGTPAEVARVNKSLLGNAPELAAIHSLTNEIRWDYYNNSLPWGIKGTNIITTDGYMDFTRRMSAGMNKWWGAVNTFMDVYPRLRDEAPYLLNGMWRAEDYPEPQTLRDKFSIDIKFFPVPDAGDWRIEMADDELERIKAKTIADNKEFLGVATQDAWKRVYKVVSHAAEKLADPKGLFVAEAMVNAATELCRVLTVLNVSGDPELERVRSEIEGSLCGQASPEYLRTDPVVRAEVADQMKDIMARMGGMYAQPAN